MQLIDPDLAAADLTLVSSTVSGPAFRAFLDAVAVLGCDFPEACRLLGDLPWNTFTRYATTGAEPLHREVLERISLVLGITQDIRSIFPDDDQGRRWFRGQNSDDPFAGQSPLEFMQDSIVNLEGASVYLKSWRQG